MNRRKFLAATALMAPATALPALQDGQKNIKDFLELPTDDREVASVEKIGALWKGGPRTRRFIHHGTIYRLSVTHPGDVLLEFLLHGRVVVARYTAYIHKSPWRVEFMLNSVGVGASLKTMGWSVSNLPYEIASYFVQINDVVNREAQEPYADLWRSFAEIEQKMLDDERRAEREAVALFAAYVV